jgi:hypothetical protein
MELMIMTMWISDYNSTSSGCDYYGGGNLRLDCLEDCPPPDHYGGPKTGTYDLLERGCY